MKCVCSAILYWSPALSQLQVWPADCLQFLNVRTPDRETRCQSNPYLLPISDTFALNTEATAYPARYPQPRYKDNAERVRRLLGQGLVFWVVLLILVVCVPIVYRYNFSHPLQCGTSLQPSFFVQNRLHGCCMPSNLVSQR